MPSLLDRDRPTATKPWLVLNYLLLAGCACFAAEQVSRQASNSTLQSNPRKLNPPPGIAVPPNVKADLIAGATDLAKEIESLRSSLASVPALLELLPDVEIFHNAVRYALEDDIFYSTNQFRSARALLKQGMERGQQLREGRAPWNTATGLVVRGFVSRLDGSVQPYGLIVPASYRPGGEPMRLDVWLHGRGDTLSEIAFLDGRQKSVGEFAPDNAFVLHPYGRFMNAFKFAGEVDVFEALEHATKHYPVDENRIIMRGFSMGGAGAWHLGAHHADKWAAVNPGAGFVDVKNYQNLGEKLGTIPWYQQQLWSLYDPLACPINLVNTSLIAYSGEIDEQKKAADLMEAALLNAGVKMTHIIGPQTGHKYEARAKELVAKLVDAAAKKGRDPVPLKVSFVTYSVKWNTMHWVRIDALEKHWERAEVIAELLPHEDPSRIEVKTRNVAGLWLGDIPTSVLGKQTRVVIDGQDLGFRQTVATERPSHWGIPLFKSGSKWAIRDRVQAGSQELAKRHNLQGPIDDAFMESFIFVRPTGRPINQAVGKWVGDELTEAAFQWRRQFRGELRVKEDSAITESDIMANNLILWGDPSSNKLLAKIRNELPIRWTAQSIKVGSKIYDARKHAPVLIYPNPLNPARYIVLNSGFTFPQFAAASNSQQTPRLPDWAVLDLTIPVAERIDGKGVVDADFFGERWELKMTNR